MKTPSAREQRYRASRHYPAVLQEARGERPLDWWEVVELATVRELARLRAVGRV